MSAYKPLFLSEAAEHLDNLEKDLLALEQHPADAERVHEAFRHLHSIKGMAGSMGYSPLSSLAHGLEDLLVPFRQEKRPLSADVVEVLLRGLDQLRQQLGQAAEDRAIEPAGEELLQAIGRLHGHAAPARGAPEPKAPDSEALRSLQVEVEISPDSQLPAARAFLVYRRLQEAGRVVRCTPTPEELRQGILPGRVLRLSLESREGLPELRRRLDLADVAAVRWLPADEKPPVPTPAPAAPSTPNPAPAAPTVRVSAELLDFFVDAVGELLAQRSHLEELSERLGSGELSGSVRALSQIVRRLHDRVMEVRLVPVSLLTDRLPRVCRDIAGSRGKKVRFAIEGHEVPIDRALVEALDTPLLHLLRNALDHGIEPPEERRARGKPEEGLLRIAVRRRHDRVLMEVSDDGRGIDPSRVLERARSLGLVPPGEPLEAAGALELVFAPGFSTREVAGEVSGRGVGLDVVRTTLTRLGGRVSVHSRPGEGTTFVLDLPLTLAVLQVLLVESAGRLLALPASRVLRVLPLRQENVAVRRQEARLGEPGADFAFQDLSALLRESSFEVSREAVVIGDGEQGRLALGVSRVAGHREVVQKPPGSLLRRAGPFAGTTVLGDGRPVLILDPDQLMERFVARGEA
ncbi:MAG: chemotaxis protein CheA [Myxococcales bacterium]|nr:chemotaxis protein CheA [Myxococcales bacterium]